MKVIDKHGIPIMPGDVLKVFHFVGARNKRHYMYKIAFLHNGKLRAAHAHMLSYQFTIDIRFLKYSKRFEMERMNEKLKQKCEDLGWTFERLVLVYDHEEDRRSNKTIPKGYRAFKFGYTVPTNIKHNPCFDSWY